MGEDRYPLYEKAEAFGLFRGRSALIVAPTATGKSYIGREFSRTAFRSGLKGVHVYLVPFRALAREVFEKLAAERENHNGAERIRIATGDHTDPIRPDETDILVATYERFSAIRYAHALQIGSLVADEFHLVADETRGPFVESLLARLKGGCGLGRFLGLSAVVENGGEIAKWLGVDFLPGSEADRKVPVTLECRLIKDRGQALADAVRKALDKGEQAIVFCNSRAGAERRAIELGELVGGSLIEEDRNGAERLAYEILAADGEAEKLADIVRSGVGFHHAGLRRDVRRVLEEGFLQGAVHVLTSTPTLAAGVNLPAGLVVVRDVYRNEYVRGRPRVVVLHSGEVLNMLGRAGRPGFVDAGHGIVFIEDRFADWDGVKRLRAAVEESRGEPLRSRMPESFENLMRFVLGVVKEAGEATLADIAEAFKHTLWYRESPQAIRFDRPFKQDMMEDIPAYQKVASAKGKIRLAKYKLTPDGIAGHVTSGDHGYDFELRVDAMTCECPAATRYYQDRICKHLACAIHDLLFDPRIEREDYELHVRAVYHCTHLFSKTLDVGTKLTQAVKVLEHWHLLDALPGGAYRTTPAGEIAAGTGWDLLLIRQLSEDVLQMDVGTDVRQLALKIVEQFYGAGKEGDGWRRAVADWIAEKDLKKIKLPTKFRGDFETGIDGLSRVARLYATLADRMGRTDIEAMAKQAAGCLLYGVAPELVPLRALQYRDLGRARARSLYVAGVRNLDDLAEADPRQLKSRHLPEALVGEWVKMAKTLRSERQRRSAIEPAERSQWLDDIVAKFRVAPEALEN